MAEPVRLRVAISGWSRTVALVKALVALGVAVAFLVSALKVPAAGLGDQEETARVVTGLVFAALGLWAALVFLPPAITRAAFLELHDDRLLVRHRGVFKQPLAVARETVKAAAVDPRPWRWRWLGNKGRFHLGRAEDDGDPVRRHPEWLFSVIGGSPFPILSNVDDVPNLAFVFTEPVRLRAVRRGLRPFATKNPVHLPLQARQVRGLLVKVTDPEEAARALATWTSVRPLTIDDVFEVEPDDYYKQKAKKRKRAANVWLTILLFVQFGVPAIAELAHRADDNSPTHEAML